MIRLVSDLNDNETVMVDENETSENSHPKFAKTLVEDYGYSLYPGRSEENFKKNLTWMGKFYNANAARRNNHCKINVKWCMQNNPLIKILSSALEKKGCKVNMDRHIACEDCQGRVNGGYDPELCQVVVCQNSAKKSSTVCTVLAHELVHAYDYCRGQVNFKNLDHLACTEVRAANLMHCQFMTAWVENDTSIFNFKAKHKECVKRKAMLSVLTVRSVDYETAKAAVDRVFQKCYDDLEPIGRRCRFRGSMDPNLAYEESYLHGYTDR